MKLCIHKLAYATLLVMTTWSWHAVASQSLSANATAYPISPKVFIISMFEPEAQVWYDRFHEADLGNLTSQVIASPGLSMLYPYAYCTADGGVCQATMGEGEINAASSMMALVLSRHFDLRSTYFLFAGIAGVNPRRATLGSVALARYAVQVALQYEIDPRSLPVDWPTGYIPFGRDFPLEYPTITYGTEVFELDSDLRDAAYRWARGAVLADDEQADAYRRKYADMGPSFGPATAPPSVLRCDTATSDVYYSGTALAESFENATTMWTNGTGVYCMTAQEDNANLEVMVRAAIDNLVDFSRIIVMRTGSNFDRPPTGVSDWDHLTHADQNGLGIAVSNIFNAGIAIVRGLLARWECPDIASEASSNYVGDILGSLGGHPDFGLGSITGGDPIADSRLERIKSARSGDDQVQGETTAARCTDMPSMVSLGGTDCRLQHGRRSPNHELRNPVHTY